MSPRRWDLAARKNLCVTLGVLTLALVCVGGLWLLGRELTRPVHRPAGITPADLPFQSVSFSSASGGRIHAWWLRPEGARGAILLLHGVRASRHSMVGRARFLARAGYAVLLPDLQAHGESDGNRITFGYLESRDVSAAVAFLCTEVPRLSRAVIGVSLGGAAAILAKLAPAFDAMILEAVYPDVAGALINRLNIRLGAGGELIAPLLLAQLGPRLGFGADALRPIDHIGMLESPVMIIAGSEDRRTTIDESRALHAAASDPKSLWVVEGAGHVDFHRFARDDYEPRVLDFLRKYLGQRVAETTAAVPGTCTAA